MLKKIIKFFIAKKSYGHIPMENQAMKMPSSIIAFGSPILHIGSKPFNSQNLFGENAKRFPHNEASTFPQMLQEVDLSATQLIVVKNFNGSSWIKGLYRFHFLRKIGWIRLDARVLQALLESQGLIPKCWREYMLRRKITYITFDGTVVQNSCYEKYVPCLYFDDETERWEYKCRSFDSLFSEKYAAAVVPRMRLA